MKYRLVHAQATQGPLIITDIDEGRPIEHLDEERKQDSYLPYYETSTESDPNGGVRVAVDTSVAGFIDLVPSDKVVLSVADGVIKGLSDAGYLSVVSIPTGALAAPTISGSTHDTATSATSATDDGLLSITGTNLLSFAPDVTSIEITDGSTTVTVADGDAGVTVTATTIEVTAAAHGFATGGTEDITSVTVTANRQSATDAPTIV